MATIRKRKDKYVVIYDYINEKGVRKQKWETCESKADASRRAKEVEYEKSRNNLIAPNNQTVAEFLAEWAPIQAKKCWQYKTYMTNMQMIEMHINPLIGKVKMQKLTPKHIDVMFMELRQKKVTGSKARNKKEEDIPYISSTMQRHIYTLLHGAMEKAVEWKVIPSNPVVCDPPPRSTTETATWDIDTLRMALDMMEDEILHLAVHLSFVCSLRIGEAMALSWDDVNLEKKEIYIRKTLQRVDKKALEELPGDSLYFMFPPKQLEKKSVLVLKKPKTKTSTRTLYITDELRNELQTRKEKIEQQRKYYGANYADYNLVFALEDGYPIEPKLCEKWFKKWQNGPGLAFPDIVFHSIRHSSTTYKLVLSQGDIKSVQGDIGHSSAKLVTDTYAHIQVDSRKALADSLEKDFYKKKDTEKSAEEKNPVDVAGLMNLIKENPELKNFLLASVLADESMKVQQMQN